MFVKLIVEYNRKCLKKNKGIKYVCILVYIMWSINLFYLFIKINFFIGWILVIFDLIENFIFFILDFYNKLFLDVFGVNE